MSSLRSLVLTPQRTPVFTVPCRSPLLVMSPRLQRSPDRTRLLSDHNDSSPGASPAPAASPRFRLRIRPPRRAAAAGPESADTDLTTRAAMSLPHVRKVTTPYGFRAVLAASPCTRRRESLFHRNREVTVTVTDTEPPPQEEAPPPGGSRVCLRPVRALGLQLMTELKKLSPATRRTRPC